MMKQQIAYSKKQQRKELVKVGFILGSAIILYMFFQTLCVTVLEKLNLEETYQSSPLFRYAFNVIGVDLFSLVPAFGLAALVLKNNFTSPLIPTKKISFIKAAAWTSFGLGLTFLANYIVAIITAFAKNNLGYELSQNDNGISNDPLTYIVMFVAVAIAPPIFEEFALRCCTLGVLRKYGSGFAVFMTSIVFGLIHGNVIQFIFAFLMGLFMAYITIKTDNIFISMFIHGINNGRSVINDIIVNAVNQQTANTVAVIFTFAIFALSIVSFIYLVTTKSFAKENKLKNIYDNSFGVKIACMIPGMIIPFAYLWTITKQYITKI